MGDMPTDFWSGWIIALTVGSFVALAWMIFSIYSPDNETEEEHETVWDGNLREGSNPAPLWWFWLILSLMVFSVIYLMLYPGLGSFSGALKWTQGGRMDASLALYDQEFQGLRSLIAEANLDTLQEDPDMMRSAQRIYDRNCAACHGYEGQGQANRFPNLIDDEWQWGNSVAQIEHSIRLGRVAAMASWEAPLGGEDGVARMAEYVQIIGTDAANGHPAQAQYNIFCVACHGVDGSGNPVLGAPSLVDDVWLYGGDLETIKVTLKEGRAGVMPAFDGRLDDTQVRLLLAWLTQSAEQP